LDCLLAFDPCGGKAKDPLRLTCQTARNYLIQQLLGQLTLTPPPPILILSRQTVASGDLMTLAEGKSCTAVYHVDGAGLAVDDFTWRPWTRGSGTDRGGWWGRSRATCGCGGSGWERQGKAEEGGEGSGGGGGGAMRKWCVVCALEYFVRRS
jgi:hypothetical protein